MSWDRQHRKSSHFQDGKGGREEMTSQVWFFSMWHSCGISKWKCLRGSWRWGNCKDLDLRKSPEKNARRQKRYGAQLWIQGHYVYWYRVPGTVERRHWSFQSIALYVSVRIRPLMVPQEKFSKKSWWSLGSKLLTRTRKVSHFGAVIHFTSITGF